MAAEKAKISTQSTVQLSEDNKSASEDRFLQASWLLGVWYSGLVLDSAIDF